ncbi:MAG TPA: twin-arginine translocation signal domain-containing protein [Deltaproteobacteria bacterium]|nr:twin-arginine translocation signal domain-containing protein [Deltaproteobacteria bacterium]
MSKKTGKKLKRRDFLKTSAIAAAAASVFSMIPKRSRSEVVAKNRAGKKFKVIDFRCRPPIKAHAGLFKIRMEFIAKRPNVLANPATFGEVPEIVKMVGKPGAVEAWWKALDKAGVDAVVVNGRYASGIPELSMGNDELLKFQKKYPGRFYGLAALNLDQPIEKTVAELEDALRKGIRGANFEPGYRTKNGGPATIDNADFYPIYETMQDAGYPLQVQTGAFAGMDNWGAANEMWRFDSTMKKFPKLKLVLAHGGYPSITEALALALKWPSVTICPDVYTFWPGGQLYQQNIELLQDQFVYGSAFPFGNIDTTLQQTLALPLSDKVMEKYLYTNAKRLLKI